MRFWGQVLWLAGLVGAVSPFLPDPGDHAASDDLVWWGKVLWVAVCVLMAVAGSQLSKVAERRAAAQRHREYLSALDRLTRAGDTPTQ